MWRGKKNWENGPGFPDIRQSEQWLEKVCFMWLSLAVDKCLMLVWVHGQMVLKVFTTTSDEISLQLWLLSINHRDPLWIRVGSGCAHAWTEAGWRERGRGRKHERTVVVRFASSPQLLGLPLWCCCCQALPVALCYFVKHNPRLILLFTGVDSGGTRILLHSWYSEMNGYYLFNPVSVLLGICLKKWLDNCTEIYRKDVSCSLGNNSFLPIKMI